MNQKLILCIDDEPEALNALSAALKGKGFDVLTAETGSAALEHLKKVVPDVILADLRMSPMNGFEIYQKVKQDHRFVTTPFFFITAVDDYLARKYGETLGVDMYITKPVNVDDLEKAIKAKLHLP